MLGLNSSNKGIIGITWYSEYRAAPGIGIAFATGRCSRGCQGDVLTLTWSPVGLEDGFPVASAPSWPRSQQGSLLHCWFRPAGQPLDAFHAIRHRGDGVGWTLIAIQSRTVAKDVLVDCRILRTHSPLTLW